MLFDKMCFDHKSLHGRLQ